MKDLVLDGSAHLMVHRIAQLNDARGLLRLLEGCGISDPIVAMPPGSQVKHFVKPSNLFAILHDFVQRSLSHPLGAGTKTC